MRCCFSDCDWSNEDTWYAATKVFAIQDGITFFFCELRKDN